MKKKALLVGINYPGTKHSLRGCVNDVVMMNEIITHHYGFNQAKHKRMLTDNSATTKNILDRLEWLVDGAQVGDVLFFHYSGHGAQFIDSKYDSDDEPDGLDELICPSDFDWRGNMIKDDDLKRVFDKVPPGVNLTVVLDCCHSGSGIDSSTQYLPLGVAPVDHDPLSPNRNRLLPMPADIANRGYGLNLPVKPKVIQHTGNTQTQTGLLISGCQSQQTSADAWIHNKYCGAATFFLAHSLQKSNFTASYRQIVDSMNHYLNKYKYSQRPELNGNPAFFDKPFLSSF